MKTVALTSEEMKNISGGAEPAYGIGYYLGKFFREAPHWISRNIANGSMHS